MAYVEPIVRADGFKISASVWNQDVVENMKALKAFTEVEPTVIYEASQTYTLTANVWNTRKLSGSLRDPDGVITNADFLNYQFDLADGTYLVELHVITLGYDQDTIVTSRLRDVSNNATLMGTGIINPAHTSSFGGNVDRLAINRTFDEFVLSNGADATVQLQTLVQAGKVGGYVGTVDTENNNNNGIYESLIKLWKIA